MFRTLKHLPLSVVYAASLRCLPGCALVLLLLFYWLAQPLAAQTLPAADGNQTIINTQLTPTVRFAHLTTQDGLAQNSVKAILQDRQGFMWFGTLDGLSRFDGYEFVTFKNDAANPNSIPDNIITGLLEDSSGMIWITTPSGVCRFDPHTERFSRSIVPAGQPDPLAGSVVQTLYRDREGMLWFGGPPNTGVVRYDPTAKEITQFLSSPTLESWRAGQLLPAPPDVIGQIGEDATGRLWFVTDTALSFYDEAQAQFRIYPLAGASPRATRLNTLYIGKEGEIWVGGVPGLFRFDTNQRSFRKIEAGPTEIDTLFGDPQGRIWIGAASGLYQFDPSTLRISPPHQHSPTLAESLSQNRLNTIIQDHAGLLWVGTQGGGVDRLDIRRSNFTFYGYDPQRPDRIASSAISRISGDRKHLWFTTPAVLHQVDLVDNTIKQFKLPASSDGHDDIHSLLVDHQGIVWLGMRGYRLLRFDPTTLRFTEQTLIGQEVPRSPGPPPDISALYEDPAGNLWIVVSWSGLFRLDAQRQMVTFYQPTNPLAAENDDPNTIARHDPMALTGDEHGMVWIGYVDGSVSHYDPQTKRFQHYSARPEALAAELPPSQKPALPHDRPPAPCDGCPPPPEGAPDQPPAGRPPLALPPSLQNGLSGWIETMHVDRQGLLWLGTRTGLVRFDPATAEYKRYTQQDGLPTNYVVGIVEDDSAQLWLSTQKGLARFDPASETFRNYDLNDGLQGNEFASNAAWKAADGTLYFGGTNGLTVFDPQQVKDDPYQPPVMLTGLRLFNLPVPIGADSPLQQAIWATDKLTLTPGQEIISFEFASLSFAAPQKNQYRYKLEGFETAWNTVNSQRRFATYTSLPAGNYTLRVAGSNADGVWSEQEVALQLVVLPHWWQTLWFRGLVLALLLVLAYVAYTVRLRSIKARNRLLEEQVAERTQALSESEARFRGLAISTFEAILLHAQGQVIDANHTAEVLFGLTHAQLLARSIHSLLPTLPSTLEAQPDGTLGELYGVTATHPRLPLEARIRQIPFQGQAATVIALRDLTERKQMEAQQQQVAAFEERERIGRDLHDNLGQVMGYMSIQAQTVRNLLDQAKTEPARTAILQLVAAAHDAHEDIRRYILNIRTQASEPPLNFAQALHLYLDQVRQRHGLSIELSLPSELPNNLLSVAADTQLLRIIQEAITNIHKHAAAQHAQLLLTLHADELQVIITDDGKGFVVESGEWRVEGGERSHFGLAIMRERAEGIGGTFEVRSKPGVGTQVIVRLPRRWELAPATIPAVEGVRGLRVLLVDDHPLYVEGLRNLLCARGIQVVGIAHNGRAALELAQKLLPDLILMDVDMPHANGIEATRLIKQAIPASKIVMLTVAAAEETLFQALKQGAVGYLLKNLDANQLLDLLREVMRGEMVLSPSLASKVLAAFAQSPTPAAVVREAVGESSVVQSAAAIEESPPAEPKAPSPTLPTLTYRQQEVLELVAQGLSNKEIAQRLDITERTVKYHVGLILESLQLRSRYELAHYLSLNAGAGITH